MRKSYILIFCIINQWFYTLRFVFVFDGFRKVRQQGASIELINHSLFLIRGPPPVPAITTRCMYFSELVIQLFKIRIQRRDPNFSSFFLVRITYKTVKRFFKIAIFLINRIDIQKQLEVQSLYSSKLFFSILIFCITNQSFYTLLFFFVFDGFRKGQCLIFVDVIYFAISENHQDKD